MKKFFNYISIALLAITLFSCNKNEWTPENEKEFKEGLKEGILKKGQGILSEEQINYITDCSTEKIKARKIQMNDLQKPENVALMKQFGKECAQECVSKNIKNTQLSNNWTPKTEKQYKEILKSSFKQSAVSSDKAEFLADCVITKLKEQKIGPADLQDRKNGDLVQKVGFTCAQEMIKKK
ncbi:hypothetical protein [Flavobacterium olei]|uniref:hypothetical protein n=1 Tax=Flavobacterium olei TaxID=1886782 RepID=UPI00321962C5